MHSTIKNTEFIELLKSYQFSMYTGVPCSFIGGLTKELEQDPEIEYIPANREDIAIGIGVGAFLSGRSTVVFLQNSALGVCLNPLTSLAIPYKIPLLLLITWRGKSEQHAPEHYLMGKITLDFLTAIDIPFYLITQETLKQTVHEAHDFLKTNQTPVALILEKGVLL